MISKHLLRLTGSLFFAASLTAQLPQLVEYDGTTQLEVGGQPFLMRGGELGNSTAGGLAHLRQYWPKLADLNLNTVVAPVYWDRSEPEEGVYDWTLMDGLIEQAREHDMRIVLLWFGAWKNSMSCYAPNWVKVDTERFPRSRDRNGRALEILSPFSEENRVADRRAFAACMRHLKEIDGEHNTVIMVQIENEIGMIPDARDYADLANAAWAQPVPTALTASLAQQAEGLGLVPEFEALWEENGRRSAGSWTDVFGPEPWSEEIFMAWHFGTYVQDLAEAGRAEYDLPFLVNAALIREQYEPGQYVSAGPLPHLINIWRAAAPAIDVLSPDIYFPEFAHWTGLYHRVGNPLLVPEALRNADASVNALYAFGEHRALGFAPFGIESISGHAERLLSDSFDLIRQLTPTLTGREPLLESRGLLPPTPAEQRVPQRIRLNNVILNVTYERTRAPSLADGVINESGDSRGTTRLPAGGLVIALGPDEFLFAGMGVKVTFDSFTPGETVGILECEQGHFDAEGAWVNDRWLGGDQTHQGRHLRLEPGNMDLQRIKLYRYQ
jgi:beta-galactosidase GanA